MFPTLSQMHASFFLIVATLLIAACSGSGEPFPIGEFQSGDVYMEFFGDGTLTFGLTRDNPSIEGEYIVKGQTLTFLSEMHTDGRVTQCHQEGSYTWMYEDKVLSFENASDTCAVRIRDNDGK